jgi:hypothetical protein
MTNFDMSLITYFNIIMGNFYFKHFDGFCLIESAAKLHQI